MNLTGRTAVVTGGSRGIGFAVAKRLKEAGVRLAVIARNAERLQQAVEQLGEGTLGMAVDVKDAESSQAAIREIETKLAPVDILVNNAGLTRDNVLVRMKESDWTEVLDVNLKGAFNMTHAVIRGMMKRRWGRIINITSVVGITGNKGQANYAASKAGLIGFTKSVAKELASRNILVNAVAPGFIDTDMTRDLPEEAKEAMLQQIPVNRLGTAGDVAGVVVFLASELADYITGQTLVVDGGMVM